ncbi:MAG: HNH endonuclease signature motif containing protein, partial [Nocardioides sp.]
VAESVVAALDPHFGVETVSELKRRTRRLIAAISPDLLKQRAARMRAECGLRRYTSEPGVDTWVGNFPSEDALHAWAAVDDLAQEYVREGICSTIEQARGKALTDLVTKQATVITHLHLTTPAEPSATEPALAESAVAEPGVAEPVTPERVSAGAESTAVQRGDGGVAAAMAEREGDDGFVELASSTHPQPVLVPADWVKDLTAKTPTRTTDILECHPETGAASDPTGDRSTEAYRIPDPLARLIRARDGHCRFPGCSIHARFCDIDHARAWPAGPTAAWNLLLLCRRHHRIKQTPGWTLTLDPDGVATWTDPTGRRRQTSPIDHLRPLTLPGENAGDGSTGAPDTLEPLHAHVPGEDAPFSRLEYHLEHLETTCRTHRSRREQDEWMTLTRLERRAQAIDHCFSGAPRIRVRTAKARPREDPDLPPF